MSLRSVIFKIERIPLRVAESTSRRLQYSIENIQSLQDSKISQFKLIAKKAKKYLINT
jgi:hypothetical protein